MAVPPISVQHLCHVRASQVSLISSVGQGLTAPHFTFFKQELHLSFHSPLLLTPLAINRCPSSFKFHRMWLSNDTFLPTVAYSWLQPASGAPLERLHFKLRRLKDEALELGLVTFLLTLTTTVLSLEERLQSGWDQQTMDELIEARRNLMPGCFNP